MNTEKVAIPRRTARKLFWLAPLAIGLLFYLMGHWADSWLESDAGRSLLQDELGKALGLPVSLQGEYGLKFLPRLQIAGTGLAVRPQERGEVLLYSKNFSAEVELIPLISQQLRIAAIELGEGFIDLANLPEQDPTSAGSEESATSRTATLPDVASLNLSNFSIRHADAAYRVDIGELQLSGFRAGVPAGLEVKAGVVRDEVMVAAVRLKGSLTIGAPDGSAELSLEEVTVAMDERQVEGLTAQVRWDAPASQANGRLQWQASGKSAHAQFDVLMSELISGTIQGEYRDAALENPLILGLKFAIEQDRIELKHLDVAVGNQHVTGTGCFRFGELAGLHLDLAAPELDVDAIAPLFQAGEGDSTDLSFVYGLELHIDKAWSSGVLANDVLLEVGLKPECAQSPEVLP